MRSQCVYHFAQWTGSPVSTGGSWGYEFEPWSWQTFEPSYLVWGGFTVLYLVALYKSEGLFVTFITRTIAVRRMIWLHEYKQILRFFRLLCSFTGWYRMTEEEYAIFKLNLKVWKLLRMLMCNHVWRNETNFHNCVVFYLDKHFHLPFQPPTVYNPGIQLTHWASICCLFWLSVIWMWQKFGLGIHISTSITTFSTVGSQLKLTHNTYMYSGLWVFCYLI